VVDVDQGAKRNGSAKQRCGRHQPADGYFMNNSAATGWRMLARAGDSWAFTAGLVDLEDEDFLDAGVRLALKNIIPWRTGTSSSRTFPFLRSPRRI
jgi:hypothetical protein